MQRLTQEAKKAIVEKALDRKGRKLSEIAAMHNIGHSTLAKWVRKYRNGELTEMRSTPSSSMQFTRSDRLKHLLAASNLDDVALGIYCRERGLYSFQLQQWKNEFMSDDKNLKNQEIQFELKTLRAENKLLKKDLLRKDKALAETTALLVLKKKANLLFGDLGDD